MKPEYEDERLIINKLETAQFGTNAYIAIDQESKESFLIDAPGDMDVILKGLEGTHPKFIVITHGHVDHTGALSELKSRLNIPVAAHPSDAGCLSLAVDEELKDTDRITVGRVEFETFHTPGHTPGSICLYRKKVLISGDTLFPGGPGRTNSSADFQQIITSLKKKIFPLPDETLVLPGHGASTILKKEKDEFASFSSRRHSPNLCGNVLWLTS